MDTTQLMVKRAALLWAGAVGAGVVEAVMGVSSAVASGAVGAGLAMEIGVHVAAYVTASVLIAYFWRGRNWARIALTVLLTGVGLASLVVPAVQSLAAGAGVVEALGGSLGPPFAIVRAVHIACVLAASVLMYTPPANRYFARRPPTKVRGIA